MLTILVVGRANVVKTRQLSRATGKNMVIGNLPGNFTQSLDRFLFGFYTETKTKAPKSFTAYSSLMFQKPIIKHVLEDYVGVDR